ncbi:hypothetical protein KP509_03G090100 [Ceratopteris richardii]|uniref:Uncharacterized protein n=1 Tax=Ceratopteris richardii TaxID=49495 RepID=A0A8T2V1U5_CERRI|nr:hypothetical protein KP509_03G090100 [Ceratopteris richardii]
MAQSVTANTCPTPDGECQPEQKSYGCLQKDDPGVSSCLTSQAPNSCNSNCCRSDLTSICDLLTRMDSGNAATPPPSSRKRTLMIPPPPPRKRPFRSVVKFHDGNHRHRRAFFVSPELDLFFASLLPGTC